MTDRAGDPIVRGMHRPLALYAFALLTFSACSSAPSISASSTGSGGAGGAMLTAMPCGFPGSDKEEQCHALYPNGVAYCGEDGATSAPFADCQAVVSDAGDADWWCCPYNDGGAS